MNKKAYNKEYGNIAEIRNILKNCKNIEEFEYWDKEIKNDFIYEIYYYDDEGFETCDVIYYPVDVRIRENINSYSFTRGKGSVYTSVTYNVNKVIRIIIINATNLDEQIEVRDKLLGIK